MSDGFFPNGQCRHYQLVDGWAKVWCIRTDPGHTEHETRSGTRWTTQPSDPWPDTEHAAAAHYAACNPEPGDPS